MVIDPHPLHRPAHVIRNVFWVFVGFGTLQREEKQGDEPGHLRVNMEGKAGLRILEELKDTLEQQFLLRRIASVNDWSPAIHEHLPHLFEARPLKQQPVNLPRILRIGPVGVGMMTVDPNRRTRLDLVMASTETGMAFPLQTQDDLVTRVIIAFEVMIGSRLDMTRSHHGIKRLEAMIRRGEGKRQDVLSLGFGAGHAEEATSPCHQKSIDEATLGNDGLRSPTVTV